MRSHKLCNKVIKKVTVFQCIKMRGARVFSFYIHFEKNTFKVYHQRYLGTLYGTW